MSDASIFSSHDHSVCRRDALQSADKTCAELGSQMTALRRRVLEILLESHKAMGAYEVLARLSEEGLGSKPPVAYRALGFLVDHGFAHRIEKMNAFVACNFPGKDHSPAFMICRECHKVAEAKRQMNELDASASETGFQIETTVVEAEGLCPACQTTP